MTTGMNRKSSRRPWRPKPTLQVIALLASLFVLGQSCLGQQSGRDLVPNGPPPTGWPGPMPGLLVGPPWRWWDDPDYIHRLALTADQQMKMDQVFDSHRVRVIDLYRKVQKEEATLKPMVDDDHTEETTVGAQIDRVAQARSELEKVLSQMLLELRRQLTHEQWLKLQAEPPRFPPGGMEGGPFSVAPGQKPQKTSP